MFVIFYYLINKNEETGKKRKIKPHFSHFLKKRITNMLASSAQTLYICAGVFNPTSLAPNAGRLLFLLYWQPCPAHLPALPILRFLWTFSPPPFLTLYLFTVFVYHLEVTLGVVSPTVTLSSPWSYLMLILLLYFQLFCLHTCWIYPGVWYPTQFLTTYFFFGLIWHTCKSVQKKKVLFLASDEMLNV